MSGRGTKGGNASKAEVALHQFVEVGLQRATGPLRTVIEPICTSKAGGRDTARRAIGGAVACVGLLTVEPMEPR